MLRSVFVAQAEYYFDTEHDDANTEKVKDQSARWLWDMNWRARIRRVRLPADLFGDGGGGATSGAGQTSSGGSQQGQCSAPAGLGSPPADFSSACGQAASLISASCPTGDGDSSLEGILSSLPQSLMLH
jgi:hypothetical protein